MSAVATLDGTALVAPHDPDTEREVLGAAIVSPERCEHLTEVLTPDDFYAARHRAMWEAITKCYANHGTVDEALIVAYLRAANTLDLVGFKGLSDVLSRSGMTQHVDAYAQLLRQYRGRRELMAAADSLTCLALDTDNDPTTLPQIAESAVRAATEVLMPVSAESAVSGFVEHHRLCLEGSESVGGIGCGVEALDSKMRLSPGWLGVILAAPSVGKTALALSYALSALRAGRPVLFISLEMIDPDLSGRIVGQIAGVPFNKQREGLHRLSERDLGRYTVAQDEAARWRHLLHIERRAAITPDMLRLSCQRIKQQHGDLGLIVLDYLQRVIGNGIVKRRDASEESQIAAASGMMKSCAMEFGAAALALSQPTSSAARAGGEAMRLSDAKGSQAIAADADVALIPHRPSPGADILSERQRATIGVPKFRHGPPFTVGEAQVRWNGARMAFETPPGGH